LQGKLVCSFRTPAAREHARRVRTDPDVFVHRRRTRRGGPQETQYPHRRRWACRNTGRDPAIANGRRHPHSKRSPCTEV